jgi:hypothetical protein
MLGAVVPEELLAACVDDLAASDAERVTVAVSDVYESRRVSGAEIAGHLELGR